MAQQLAQIPEFAHLFGAQAVGVKIEGQVDDAPRLDPVPQYRNPRQGDGFQRQVGGGGGQVGQGQAGQRGQRLGAVRRLLPGVQFPLLLLQRGAVGLGPGRGLPSEALGLGLAAGLAGGVARGQHRLGLVRVLEEDAPQQVLKVALAHLGAQAVEQVTHLQVRFRLAAVQPAFQRLHTQAHARRVGAEIPHPHLELPPGQGGFQLGAVDALPGQAAQFVKNRLLGSGRVFGVEVGDLHLQPGLGHAVVHPQHQVPGQLAGQNRPAQRGFVVPGQHLGQHPGGHQRLAVGVAAQHKAVAQAGAAGLLGLAGHLVLDALHAAVHRGLQRREHRALAAGKAAQVFLVHHWQHGVQVHGAVQKDQRVGGRVELAVGGQELFVSQVWNAGRIAARHKPVGHVGEKRTVEGVCFQFVSVGKSALHLVEYDALVVGVALGVKLIPPALLPEDGGVMVDGRVEHRVKIHPHQGQKVLGVAAGNGVERLVREGQRIQKGVHRVFEQFNKRLLDRVAVRPAEHRVLEDMKDAGIVARQGGEGDAEGFILLIPLQPDQPRASLRVFHLVQGGVEFRQRGLPDFGKTVKRLAHNINPSLSGA